MKIYLTGSTGTIGSKFTNVTNLSINLLDTKTFPYFDLNDSATVIHLAGIVGENNINLDIEKAKTVNILGTIAFAKHILNFTNFRFIFVSSSHVYGNSAQKHKEDEVLEPINRYGEQKLIVEEELTRLYSATNRRFVTARVFSVLGPNMKRGTLGHSIQNISIKNPLNFCDDTRDFLTPTQVANFLSVLANASWKYKVYNICSGVGQTIRSAAIKYLKDLQMPINFDLFKPGTSQIPIILGDNTRLIQLISTKDRNDVSI